MQFRDLTANEIEVRVGQISDGKGCTLLLYKDARCDMSILDETVGAENWQREHYECKGNLFCRVGINVNFGNITRPEKWVHKSDCGAESKTEAEKGEASDSFKRACVNWGIGRELYTAPFIWIKCPNVRLEGKKTKDKFSVHHIEIKDKKIIKLSIKNDSIGGIVFEWENGKTKNVQPPPTNTGQPPQTSMHPPSQPQVDIEKQTLVDNINAQIRKLTTLTGLQSEFIKKTAQANTKCEGVTTEELRKINHYVAEWVKVAEQDKRQ